MPPCGTDRHGNINIEFEFLKNQCASAGDE